MDAKKRNALHKSTFALPSKRKYPIPDKAHAKSALSYAARKDTEGDEKTVRKAVLKKFPGLKKKGKPKPKPKAKGKSKLHKWD
jgi:hypothetical protein